MIFLDALFVVLLVFKVLNICDVGTGLMALILIGSFAISLIEHISKSVSVVVVDDCVGGEDE